MIFQKEAGSIFLMEGNQMLAELTYREEGDHYNVFHTYVDDSLRGQGIAAKLMQEYVQLLETEQKKSSASCSYAQQWFSRHDEARTHWLP